MPMRYICDAEIAYRQHEIRTGAHRARTQFSVTGLRRIIGNTIIAFGTCILGNRHYQPVATDWQIANTRIVAG